jgi:hypothetical protein
MTSTSDQAKITKLEIQAAHESPFTANCRSIRIMHPERPGRPKREIVRPADGAIGPSRAQLVKTSSRVTTGIPAVTFACPPLRGLRGPAIRSWITAGSCTVSSTQLAHSEAQRSDQAAPASELCRAPICGPCIHRRWVSEPAGIATDAPSMDVANLGTGALLASDPASMSGRKYAAADSSRALPLAAGASATRRRGRAGAARPTHQSRSGSARRG